MKTAGTFIGWILGVFLGFCVMNTIPYLTYVVMIGGPILGRYIGGMIEENKEQNAKNRMREAWEQAERERVEEKKRTDRYRAMQLAKNYPEATKFYFKQYWNINKSQITESDITDDKVPKLLSLQYAYDAKEQELNATYRAQIEGKKAAEQRAEQKRQMEIAQQKQREKEEIRKLCYTLPQCVSNWETRGTMKHKYFHDYYSYERHKINATYEMKGTWQFIWGFKNDTSKGITKYEYNNALNKAVKLVKDTLVDSFGNRVKYLTLVCLTASTQRKSDLRFKEFATNLCNTLNMTNGYDHIKVVEGGSAKHDGGTGVSSKQYDGWFFDGKYVILFDDVRTSGNSLEREKRTLESLGATVICAITLAQTRY